MLAKHLSVTGNRASSGYKIEKACLSSSINLESSVSSALDLFDLARESGHHEATADMLVALRKSQARISEAIRECEKDFAVALNVTGATSFVALHPS